MKNIKQFYSLIVLLSLLGLSCKQVTKSIDETFHPNDSLAKKYNQENSFGKHGAYTSTTKTTTSTQHLQNKTVVINGDTINTSEMQGKAKALFDDIELLKQKQTPADSKEIQKRVNEFLKEMKLPQTVINDIGAEKPAIKVKKGILNAAELNNAQEKLRRLPQYRNKEIVVYESVHFYDDGSINLALQHPSNPKYVDAYQYKDGNWSAPKPVLARNIERRIFPLNKMSFADAHKVVQIYNEKAAEVEGAKPSTSVYISIWDNGMRWFPGNITGTRERYDIQFNNDGTLKSFRQE
ncbi:hypothetical protein J7E50_23460 [Pedobacter sp. ISL-68]|uniref:hypothetical protein n=1 Tax=unclassified Pedobacter TaxID=2628915 RepID=UPI001BEB162C|nr:MULTISPECIES: hypothetical protein [unclassified Pedobacter]MBT2564378.1 hypothetical protein [Pedobacter sp. ISL-64]MBT2593198.1 hypothetical protein [Pedobacter sp. ISL-68]